MLSLIFYSILTVMSVGSWSGFQFAMFLGALMFGLFWSSGFTWWGLGWGLSLDSTAAALVSLSFWIVSLVILASQIYKEKSNYPWMFLLINSVLMSFLFLTFSSKDYLSFYIYFESSLGPTMILILGWGYQPERLQAGVYMLFYTLFASLPLLVSILTLSSKSGTSSIELLSLAFNSSSMSLLWYICSILAFLVKLPVYGVHLWLPKAHVEAPVAGSMVLAGVLLKLGGYGLLRILPIFSKSVLYYSWVNLVLGVLGGVVVSLMCLRQTDVKSLIAYSSVAHMGVVLSGLVTLTLWGVKGAVVVMVGHGLCSSGLFCLANIGYERTGSRSILIGKGLLNFMPSMALWWFLLTIGNMSAPPTLNMLGEIQIIIGLMSWSKGVMWSLFLLLFFSVTYSLYMYSVTQHGKYLSAFGSCCSGSVREYLLIMLHWLPLNLLFLKSDLFV